MRLYLLSKIEREFVENPHRFSKKAAKDLRYRIKKKIKKTRSDLELLLQRIDSTGIDPKELLLSSIDIQDSTIQKTDITKHKVLRSQKNTTKRYDSLSELENW